MRKFSPFVRQHLGALQKQNGDHPDANLLLAFAERNLSSREQAAMLTHLAECPACREVLALSAKMSADDAASGDVLRTRGGPWLGWRLAAAAAIVCAVIGTVWGPLVFKRSSEITSPSIVVSRPPVSVPEPLFPKESDFATAKPQMPAKGKKEVSRQRNQVELADRYRVPSLEERYRVPSMTKLGVAKAGTEAETSDGSISITAAEAEVRAALPRPPPALPPATTVAPAPPASQVVVPSLMFSAGSRAASRQSLLLAQRSNPGSVWSLEGAPAEGTLRKSDDGGRTWRTISIDNATRFYALSGTGSNVWVGGADGKLFHSIDDGMHWTAMSVTDGDMSLAGAIIGIDAHGDSVTLKTDSGATWITDDDGVHWKHK